MQMLLLSILPAISLILSAVAAPANEVARGAERFDATSFGVLNKKEVEAVRFDAENFGNVAKKDVEAPGQRFDAEGFGVLEKKGVEAARFDAGNFGFLPSGRRDVVQGPKGDLVRIDATNFGIVA